MRLSDHRRTASLLISLFLVGACSKASNPTGPSPLSLLPESTGPSGALSAWAAQSQPGAVVDWACFTRGIGCPLLPMSEPVFAEEPPLAPSNLAFTISGSTVVLTWSAPGGGGPVVSYILEAGTGPGLSNITTFNTGSTATTFTATNVPDGSYVVRVRARNADGTSGASNEVTIVVTTGPCPPPGAPTGLTQSVSGNTVTLQWNAFTGAIAYIIEAGSSSGATNIIVFDTGSAATSFSGSAPAGTYFIRIRVRTACGTSGVSNEVIATVGGPPPPGPSLTGLWTGTISPRLSSTQQVDFTQSGDSLTGVVRNRAAGQGITFQLTRTGPNTYAGTMTFEGTGGGACGAGAQSGSVTVSPGPPTTMTGSFTLPSSGSCPSQTNQVNFTKQ